VRVCVPSIVLVGVLAAGALAASGGGGQHGGNVSDGGGPGGTAGGGFGGSSFNQCGVAAPAPLPIDTGQCTAVRAPAIADFDDYVAGTGASSYTYYVNGKPPASAAVLGAIHTSGMGRT
jgi:hypothetical protein